MDIDGAWWIVGVGGGWQGSSMIVTLASFIIEFSWSPSILWRSSRMISRELSRTIHSGLEWSAPVEGVGVLEESFSIVFLFFRRLFRILILPLMETGAIESLTLLIGMSAAVVVVVVVVVLVLVVMVVVGTDLAI